MQSTLRRALWIIAIAMVAGPIEAQTVRPSRADPAFAQGQPNASDATRSGESQDPLPSRDEVIAVLSSLFRILEHDPFALDQYESVLGMKYQISQRNQSVYISLSGGHAPFNREGLTSSILLTQRRVDIYLAISLNHRRDTHVTPACEPAWELVPELLLRRGWQENTYVNQRNPYRSFRYLHPQLGAIDVGTRSGCKGSISVFLVNS